MKSMFVLLSHLLHQVVGVDLTALLLAEGDLFLGDDDVFVVGKEMLHEVESLLLRQDEKFVLSVAAGKQPDLIDLG